MSDYMTEVRANIAAARQAEKDRIDRIVKEASKGTEIWAAEQALAKRQAEQAREAAIQAREQAKIEAARDAYRAELRRAWVGTEEEFDHAFPGLWARHQKEAARQALADQQEVARHIYSRSF
jgi:6-phosphogluconate dehydrogenase